MNEVFYRKQASNFFDNMVVDVGQVYSDYPIHTKASDARPNRVRFAPSPFHKLYRNPLVPLTYRNQAWHVLRRVHLDLSWFEQFKAYWSQVLHGRPLWTVHDFYFLKNLYRVKFQDNQVPDDDNSYTHLAAWQRPELLYQLLHLVSRETVLNQTGILRTLSKLKRNTRSLLEFGCGTAPVITSLFEFYRPPVDYTCYMADIQTLAFHYAAYRFRTCTNVLPVLLLPENDFLFDLARPLDAIFCLTVFEHLNKPLEIARIFHRLLHPGGLLFFDYIKSEGEGLDTLQALRERNAVLGYISEHFTLVQGQFSAQESMGLTVVRKP